MLVMLVAAAPASAGFGIGVVPEFPNEVTVGDSDVDASLTVTNLANGADAAAIVTLERISLVPGCANLTTNEFGDCANPDPGVITLDSVGAVGTGGSCDGAQFTIAPDPLAAAQGRYLFVPLAGSVVLQAPGDALNNDECTISFTFDVLRTPALDRDARPLIDGLQTAQVAFARGDFLVPAVGANPPRTVEDQIGSGSDFTTINPLPVIQVVKTATPLSRPAPGGTFTFSLVVSNPGPVSVTITSLTDDIYGNIGTSTAAANTCDELIGDTLAVGASATCSFEGNFTGTGGQSQTDVVTVVGTDEDGNTVTDTDDAIVTLTPPPTGPPPPPPPPVVAPPPPPPPAQGVAAATPRGTANIIGKTGCPVRPFNVVVSGRQIQRVIFSVDGKVVRTLSSPNSGSRYKLLVNPRTMKLGTHRVLARVTYTRASGSKSRTLRTVFSRCARRAALPAFTG